MAYTPRAPKVPNRFNWNIYGGTIKSMNNLYAQYAANKFNYKPNKFTYGGQTPDREQYENTALRRQKDVVAAKRYATNQNIGNAQAQYQQAARQASAEEQQAAAGVNRQAEIDAGRLSNMMANAGVSGQGAAEQMYGLRGVAAQQIADNAVKYGLQRSQAATALAQASSGYRAEQNMAEAQAYSDAQAMADQMYQQGFQNYMAERGQSFNEWGQQEQMAYQAALDAYQSQQNSLNNQLGVLGQIAGLRGQTYQNAYQDIWNRYNAQYGQYQDINQWNQQNSINKQQYDMYMSNLASTNANNAAMMNYYNQSLAQAGQMPPITWQADQYGNMVQYKWDAQSGQYVKA